MFLIIYFIEWLNFEALHLGCGSDYQISPRVEDATLVADVDLYFFLRPKLSICTITILGYSILLTLRL